MCVAISVKAVDSSGSFLYLRLWGNGVVSIDIERHMLEMKEFATLPPMATQDGAATPEKRTSDSFVGKRRRWMAHEDAKILNYVELHGHNWRALSRHMGGRDRGYSDDAIRNRYMRMAGAVGATPVEGRFARRTPSRGAAWTKQEDLAITAAYTNGCNSWSDLAHAVGTGRTPAAVKLRSQRLGLCECAATLKQEPIY